MNVETGGGPGPEELGIPEESAKRIIESFAMAVSEKKDAPIEEIIGLAGVLQQELQEVADTQGEERDILSQYWVAQAYRRIIGVRPDYQEYYEDALDGLRMTIEYDPPTSQDLRAEIERFLAD